jgi:O-antigen ligase
VNIVIFATLVYVLAKDYHKLKSVLKRSNVLWFLIILYTLPFLEYFVHNNPVIRQIYFGNLINVCIFFLVFCVLVDSQRILRRVGNVLIILGLVNAAISIAQFWGGTAFFYQSYFYDYVYDYSHINVFGYLSPSGLLTGRNYNVIFGFLPLSLLMFKSFKRHQYIKYFCISIIVLGILVTLSLSLVFLFPVFIILCLFYRGYRKGRIILLSIGMIIVAAFIMVQSPLWDLYIKRAGVSGNPIITEIGNAFAYVEVVKAGYHAFLNRPLFGYGYTGFSDVAYIYFRNYTGLWKAIGSEHNMYIDILVRGGLVGGFLWFLVFFNVLKEYHKIIYSNKHHKIRVSVYPYYIFLILIFVKGFTQFPLYSGLTYFAIPIAIPYIYRRISSVSRNTLD